MAEVYQQMRYMWEIDELPRRELPGKEVRKIWPRKQKLFVTDEEPIMNIPC
jgi:hypothetical protein